MIRCISLKLDIYCCIHQECSLTRLKTCISDFWPNIYRQRGRGEVEIWHDCVSGDDLPVAMVTKADEIQYNKEQKLYRTQKLNFSRISHTVVQTSTKFFTKLNLVKQLLAGKHLGKYLEESAKITRGAGYMQ